MKIATAALALTLAWMIGPWRMQSLMILARTGCRASRSDKNCWRRVIPEITERRLSRRLFRYLSCDEMSQRALILRDP